jgi:4-alpha-glucanotransferase
MTFVRSSGILLHPTSLPGPHGVGDFGPEGYRFVDFLHSAGQKLWQVLPLNPTGYADSPFQCFSASAGNPLLISLDQLSDQGLLTSRDLRSVPTFPVESVVYGAAIRFKMPLLQSAASNFFADASARIRSQFEEFCSANAVWLDDFALFMAVKRAHNLVAWTQWPGDIAGRLPEAMQRASKDLAPTVQAEKFFQYEFFHQWKKLREYGRAKNIRIIGDVPIYVAHDSADVWANRQFFLLDERGSPLKMSGVPPDYFKPDTDGGSSECVQPCVSTISFASIISVASRPTGKFPREKPLRSMDAG